MRCPNCNKFTGLTFEDPEVQEEVAVNEDTVTATVRIVRNTECCSDEAKEAVFEMEDHIPPEVMALHTGDGHELSVEADDPEPIETGGGRYAKSFFGVSIEFTIRCSCQKSSDDALYHGTLSDKVAASEMENLLE